MGHVGWWPQPILTALLLTGRVFLHVGRNPARGFLRASARAYSHNTATRMASKGLRVAPGGGVMRSPVRGRNWLGARARTGL